MIEIVQTSHRDTNINLQKSQNWTNSKNIPSAQDCKKIINELISINIFFTGSDGGPWYHLWTNGDKNEQGQTWYVGLCV